MASRRKTVVARTESANTEQPPRVVAGWTVARIELAKRMANSGDLSLAADLWEMILGDERALGPLQALAGISSVPVSFETALPETDSSDDPLVADLERDFWAIFPEDLQGEIIRWAIGIGVVPVHASSWEADQETGRLLPKYDVWHPRALRFDAEQAIWKIRTRSNSDGVELTPGDSEWLLFTPYGAKRPWAKAPWYGLGLLWYAAQCAKLGWFDWNDSHAAPTRVASNTRTGDEGLLDDESRQALTTKVASLVRGGHITMPEGYDLKLLESASKNWESFVKCCHEVWPMAVAIALTGNNLTTQIEGGSFAASKTAENVSYACKRTIARCLETTERSQCLTWWAEFNFASAAPPWPKYQIDPPKDLTAAASRFAQAAQGLQTLRNAGYEIEDGEEDRVEELLGIRVRKASLPPPTDPNQPPKPVAKADRHRHGHEERTVAKAADAGGLEQGQRFVDAVVEQGVTEAAKVLDRDIVAITKIINESADLGSVRERLFVAYREMDPADFLAILEKAEVMAARAGRWSVNADE